MSCSSPSNILWVIDTNILYLASGDASSVKKISFDKRTDYIINAIKLLGSICKKDSLVMDAEGNILGQYDKCLRHTHSSFLSEWLEEMKRTPGKLKFVSSNLDPRHRKKLEELKFDKDDYYFVGTASNSNDKLIISEDPDYYEDGVYNYITNEMGVIVGKLNDGENIASRSRISVTKKRRHKLIKSSVRLKQ